MVTGILNNQHPACEGSNMADAWIWSLGDSRPTNMKLWIWLTMLPVIGWIDELIIDLQVPSRQNQDRPYVYGFERGVSHPILSNDHGNIKRGKIPCCNWYAWPSQWPLWSSIDRPSSWILSQLPSLDRQFPLCIWYLDSRCFESLSDVLSISRSPAIDHYKRLLTNCWTQLDRNKSWFLSAKKICTWDGLSLLPLRTFSLTWEPILPTDTWNQHK